MHIVYQSNEYSPDRVQKRYLGIVPATDGVAERFRCYEVDRQHRTIREMDMDASAYPFWAVETAYLLQGAAFNKVLMPNDWKP